MMNAGGIVADNMLKSMRDYDIAKQRETEREAEKTRSKGKRH